MRRAQYGYSLLVVQYKVTVIIMSYRCNCYYWRLKEPDQFLCTKRKKKESLDSHLILPIRYSWTRIHTSTFNRSTIYKCEQVRWDKINDKNCDKIRLSVSSER